MPKEGIIFGVFSNIVLNCGSKTVSYIGLDGDIKAVKLNSRNGEISTVKMPEY